MEQEKKKIQSLCNFSFNVFSNEFNICRVLEHHVPISSQHSTIYRSDQIKSKQLTVLAGILVQKELEQKFVR